MVAVVAITRGGGDGGAQQQRQQQRRHQPTQASPVVAPPAVARRILSSGLGSNTATSAPVGLRTSAANAAGAAAAAAVTTAAATAVSSPGSSDCNPSPQPPRAAPLLEKMISACVGAVLTSLAVTPLDVVKTRMQASSGASVVSEAASEAASAAMKAESSLLVRCNSCGVFLVRNGLTDICVSRGHKLVHLLSKPIANGGQNGALTGGINRGTGVLSALFRIGRTEGVSGLYSGLSPTLLMAVPQTAIYFTCYDSLKETLQARLATSDQSGRSSGSSGSSSSSSSSSSRRSNSSSSTSAGLKQAAVPALAGGLARSMTQTVVSPLELIRTKMLAQEEGQRSSIRRIFLTTVRGERGFLGLWKGLGPTLWRDVPFSVMYWVGYDAIRANLEGLQEQRRTRGGRGGGGGGAGVSQHNSSDEAGDVMLRSFVAGAGAGTVASLVTHPFDVVKTRRQVESYTEDIIHTTSSSSRSCSTSSCPRGGQGSLAVLLGIVRQEGLQGAFSGLKARLMRVAPACAIMISSYEGGKHLFGVQEF